MPKNSKKVKKTENFEKNTKKVKKNESNPQKLGTTENFA